MKRDSIYIVIFCSMAVFLGGLIFGCSRGELAYGEEVSETAEVSSEAASSAEATEATAAAGADQAHVGASGDANINGSVGHMDPKSTETASTAEVIELKDAAGNPIYDENGEMSTEYHDSYPVSVTDPNAPAIIGHSAIVMDARTGRILYGKNEYERHYPASITKVMTSLVALEHVSLSDTITFSYDSIWGIERDSNHIALDVGEQITAEQCLYAILLCSANEASWGMSEHVGGSVEGFAQMMNDKAAELGCLDTHFTNAHGLHDDDHYTTAYDMALITRAAIQNPIFRTIDETQYYQIPPTNLCEEPRDLWHQLKMLNPNSNYYYDSLEGGKTGFTDQARNTLVTYAKQGDMELICVIMDCRGARNAYYDTKKLYEYYFANYTYAYPLESFQPSVSNRSDLILKNFYQGLDHDTLNLTVDHSMPVVVPKGAAPEDLRLETSYDTSIKDNVVGHVTIYYKDEPVGTSDIYYTNMTMNDEVLYWGSTPEEKKARRNLRIRIFAIVGGVLLILLIVYIILRARKELNRRRRHNRGYTNVHF